MSQPPIEFLAATLADHSLLTALMQEYYALDGLHYTPEVSAAVVTLLEHSDYGEAYLLLEQQEVVGYAVLTWWFSLEFQGKAAFLDEIYLRPQARGRGLGSVVIEQLASHCRRKGIKTVRLEVEHENQQAQKTYLKNGFQHHDRYLMTKWL